MNNNDIIYENYEMYNPDGVLMCYCSKRRVDWYVSRNLGTLDGNKLYLNFKPKGDGEPDKYLIKRKNKCVISGLKNNLSKHHVVPYCYRQHFRRKFKESNSFDVVPLNRQIHNEYEIKADVLKDKLLTYLDVDYDKKSKALNACNSFIKRVRPNVHRIKPKTYIIKNMMFDKYMKLYEWDEEFVMNNSNFDYEATKDIVELFGEEFLSIMWRLHFKKYGKPEYMFESWNPMEMKIVNRKSSYYIYEPTKYELKILKDLNLLDVYMTRQRKHRSL